MKIAYKIPHRLLKYFNRFIGTTYLYNNFEFKFLQHFFKSQEFANPLQLLNIYKMCNFYI